MPIIVLLALAAVFAAIIFALKMKKSSKFDHFVKDITEPIDVTPKTSDGVIKDISAAEKALQKDAKAKQAEAERLQEESAKIGDYLTEKGVVKPTDKGKEAAGNEVTK